MATPFSSPHPSPEAVFNGCHAYQLSFAIKAAVELSLFTAIAEGASDVSALAVKCTAQERGIRILCDYLTIHGFLAKDGRNYALTPSSAIFLDQHSPAYLGSAVNFLVAPMFVERMQNLAAIIRRGQTDDSTVASDHPMWVEFARSMAPLTTAAAAEIAAIADPEEPCRVLDIAAGHGVFGIAVAQWNPKARITALDWPNVLEVAWENARRAGVADRYGVIAGNALDAAYGSGYDMVLITNFLHHFDRPVCESILRKVRAALKPGGRAITLESIPNPDRISPPFAASFSMVMLGATPAGDAYTFGELNDMLRHAGFSHNELRPLQRSPQQIVIST